MVWSSLGGGHYIPISPCVQPLASLRMSLVSLCRSLGRCERLRAWPGALLSFLPKALGYILCAVLGGAVPMLLATSWWPDKLAPLTGLISRQSFRDLKAALRAEQGQRLKDDASEPMEWFNFLVEQLWPGVTQYTEGMIRSYERSIQASALPLPP